MIKARDFLNAVEPDYFNRQIDACVLSGGLVFLSADLVYLIARYDPLEGDHAHTAYIMIVFGNASMMLLHEDEFKRAGFTHVAWNRALKRNSYRHKKLKIETFARLLKCMTK